MPQKRSSADIVALYRRLWDKGQDKQSKMKDVLAVREGRMKDVYRDLFPEGPYEDGIVANMIDVAARDIAEVLAPLPTFSCLSALMTSDAARKKAEKRTLIANGIVSNSKLQIQMYDAADWYLSYGYGVAIVEPDVEEEVARIQFYDPMGVYYLKDRWGRTECVFMSRLWDRDELMAAYPEAQSFIKQNYSDGLAKIEVVRYHDAYVDGLFLPQGPHGTAGLSLDLAQNPLGKCMARVIKRPGISELPRGQFDDVLAVQVAKSRFALLTLEAATKAVEAPITLPMDVVELNIGADAVLRTASPEKIGRVPLAVPHEVFAQQQTLADDLSKGSRYPDQRTGAPSGSVVTGRGVEALMSGFDTQIRTGQALFADMLTDLVSLAFEMEEKLWGKKRKTLRGESDGVKFTVEYTPDKDIAGDYTVDVQYGLMAGLDPNRALVFGLQARGDKLISREFLRRQMPFSVNATEEEAKTDIEDLRDALKQFLAGYAQAIPLMMQQGQDPSQTLFKIASVIDGRAKGKSLESLVLEAFEPPEQPDAEGGETPPGVEPAGAEASPVPGSPDSAPPGGDGGPPFGMDPSGRLRGVPYGQAGLPPGGRPDVQSLLAGLTAGGAPALAATVARRKPIA